RPCQDHVAGQIIETGFGPVLVAACSDGAGSADLSDVGAKLAVDAVITTARQALSKESLEPAGIDPDLLREWNATARHCLEREAEQRGVALRELACTLLTAVVGPSSVAFSQIGDGVIVLGGPEGYGFVFWPESGEYANTTRFLTDAGFEDYLRT